ncbi:MAG: heavy-metal-associated domain-containing protein [Gammaproteobacteria bacterium]|nr:heavy-metal-associated domain-containing protein [Gammaproteobacteria bacterium]
MKRHLVIAWLSMLGGGVAWADDTHYQLHVDGLVCPFCAYSIEKNVGKLDGVIDVQANLKEGLVSVLVADGKTLDEEVVRQTITNAGFTLVGIESHEPAIR